MVIDMNYWTKVLKKLMILIISLFGLYLVFKVAVFYLPFLIAFILALILEPAIRFLMRNCKFKRNVSSIIILVLVTGILLGLIAWGIATIISEGSNLLDNLGTYVTQATRFIQDILKDDNLKKFNIPNNVITTIEKSATDLLRNSYILVVTFLALYFICTDKVYIIDQMEHHLPEIWVKKLYKHLKEIITALGKYLKAQALLILISFIISVIGLYIFKIAGLNVKYPLLYALGIGFVDALPIFGSGSVMVPWAIISACNGDMQLAISVFLLWIFMSVVRQLIEPRIVGNKIGIHPIFTLIAMYTGFKVMGVMGLFIGPIMLIILKSIFSDLLDKGVVKSIFSRDYS